MSRLHFRLAAVLLAVLLAGLIAITWRGADLAEGALLPETVHKAETLGHSLGELTERALDYGIPLTRLVGVDDLYRRTLEGNPELAFIALYRRDDGVLLFAAGPAPADGGAVATSDTETVVLPIGGERGWVARLVIGLDADYARRLVFGLWIDLAIVLAVTALVALELISLTFGAGAHHAFEAVEARLAALRRGELRLFPPVADTGRFGRLAQRLDAAVGALGERFARLGDRATRARATGRLPPAAGRELAALEARFAVDATKAPAPVSALSVRAVVFVFMLAEELTRPFLPAFIRDHAMALPGLSAEVVISLPLVLFLAIVALAQPFLGGMTKAVGRGRALGAGCALGIAGHLGMSLAPDFVAIVVARAITAAGFALVFVSAQGVIIDTTSTQTRGRALAVFIGAILVAGLCGPPIGGILADQFGTRTAFLAAAALAALSLGITLRTVPRGGGQRSGASGVDWTVFRVVARSPVLIALFFGCALPAKLILTAVCFFLVPLHLAGLEYDQAVIGRVMMLYALAMVVLVPVFANLSDRFDRRVEFVAAGGMLAGLTAIYALADTGSAWVMAAMLLQLGIAQALSIAAQSALVGVYAHRLGAGVDETALYGMFRLIERSGSALGPALAGALLGWYGFDLALAVIAGLAGLGALGFAGLTLGRRGGSGAVAPVSTGAE